MSTENNKLTSQKRRLIDKSDVSETSRGRRHSDQCLQVINNFLSNQSIEQAMFSITGELKNLFSGITSFFCVQRVAFLLS